MRIAIASSGLGHVRRGIEAWAADLGCALAARGEDVSLYKGGGSVEHAFERVIPCWQRAGGKARRLLSCLPRSIAWRLGLGSGYAIEQATFTVRLLKHLRRDRVDILHVQDPSIARMAQRARRMGIVPTRVVLGHGTEESLEFIRKIDYLQHLAPWHLEEARRAGAWKATWTAIPNFVDTAHFVPQGSSLRDELEIPPDALVVLTAAAIKPQHKRIDYLIDEFACLRAAHPDMPVWLIVAGGWEPQTDELVRLGRERLGDRVRFLVRFPRERMADLYRTADVFVLCSLKEMMPIALLEATASGLPCLVNRHPVVEWMVGPGGQAIDMATSGALASAMAELLHDRDGARALGEQARQYCVDNFSRDRVVDQILQYYQFVLTHDRPAAVKLWPGTAGS